ncbi:MAG: hypothetical protein ACYC96_01975 [Fimbriimonadaceae bacterium]
MLAIEWRHKMDKSDISRRETFRLARFGVLLAAGLGVVERSSADAPQKGLFDQRMIKGEAGALVMKLYKPQGEGFELLKTTYLKGITFKQLSQSGTQFTLKFWRGGTTLVTISDVMMKY